LKRLVKIKPGGEKNWKRPKTRGEVWFKYACKGKKKEEPGDKLRVDPGSPGGGQSQKWKNSLRVFDQESASEKRVKPKNLGKATYNLRETRKTVLLTKSRPDHKGEKKSGKKAKGFKITGDTAESGKTAKKNK